jgi:hypothetical protein
MITSSTNKVFKVIVAGGRYFNNYKLLKYELDFLLSEKVKQGYKIIIISGHANGADKLGEKYAIEKGYEVIYKAADWDQFGKAAGYRRNVEMSEIADACVAFWDGESKGTKHMIDISKSKKLALRIVNY